MLYNNYLREIILIVDCRLDYYDIKFSAEISINFKFCRSLSYGMSNSILVDVIKPVVKLVVNGAVIKHHLILFMLIYSSLWIIHYL